MKLHLDLSKYPGDVKKRLDYIAHSGIEGILTEIFFKNTPNTRTWLISSIP